MCYMRFLSIHHVEISTFYKSESFAYSGSSPGEIHFGGRDSSPLGYGNSIWTVRKLDEAETDRSTRMIILPSLHALELVLSLVICGNLENKRISY